MSNLKERIKQAGIEIGDFYLDQNDNRARLEATTTPLELRDEWDNICNELVMRFNRSMNHSNYSF